MNYYTHPRQLARSTTSTSATSTSRPRHLSWRVRLRLAAAPPPHAVGCGTAAGYPAPRARPHARAAEVLLLRIIRTKAHRHDRRQRRFTKCAARLALRMKVVQVNLADNSLRQSFAANRLLVEVRRHAEVRAARLPSDRAIERPDFHSRVVVVACGLGELAGVDCFLREFSSPHCAPRGRGCGIRILQ